MTADTANDASQSNARDAISAAKRLSKQPLARETPEQP
jgi:hypothetical protein